MAITINHAKNGNQVLVTQSEGGVSNSRVLTLPLIVQPTRNATIEIINPYASNSPTNIYIDNTLLRFWRPQYIIQIEGTTTTESIDVAAQRLTDEVYNYVSSGTGPGTGSGFVAAKSGRIAITSSNAGTVFNVPLAVSNLFVTRNDQVAPEDSYTFNATTHNYTFNDALIEGEVVEFYYNKIA